MKNTHSRYSLLSVAMLLILLAGLILTAACRKKDSSPKEEKLSLAINQAGVVIHAANNLPIQIRIKTTMPVDGVKVDVLAKQELNNTPVTPAVPSYITKDSVSSAALVSLPRQVWINVMVKVSSVRNPTNSDSSSFRLIYK